MLTYTGPLFLRPEVKDTSAEDRRRSLTQSTEQLEILQACTLNRQGLVPLVDHAQKLYIQQTVLITL